jgi:hypothetical protein
MRGSLIVQKERYVLMHESREFHYLALTLYTSYHKVTQRIGVHHVHLHRHSTVETCPFQFQHSPETDPVARYNEEMNVGGTRDH